MDLKIAAIALTQDATILTRNQKDFGQILNLKIEDWSL
jgi:tRNA(fMet)-specific endonuclease VapC